MSNNRRSRRLASKSKQIDYKTFHKTGKKVLRRNNQEINDIVESDEHESHIEDQAIAEISELFSNCQVDDSQPLIIARDTNSSDIISDNQELSLGNQMSSNDSNTVPAMAMAAEAAKVAEDFIRDLQSKMESTREDIEDYLDENCVDFLIVANDVDDCINKVEKQRTLYRNLNNELAKYTNTQDPDNDHYKLYQHTMFKIKKHILAAKEQKLKIRQNESAEFVDEKNRRGLRENEEAEKRKRAAKFLIDEINRMINELMREFEKDNDVSDEELMRRKDDLNKNLSEVEKVSNKFQRLVEVIPDTYTDCKRVVEFLTEKYNALIHAKKLYENCLQEQIGERELLKEKSFQTSYLNIRLKRFKGYSSEIDVYSFQREFEKLYLKATPKKMLPDLLKNNYLADSALALVKTLDSIDEIWIRLKKAYGDCRVMLKKKLAEMKNIGPLWKLKDENLKDALVNLINFIDDLIKLAESHNIEQKLYNGDGLDIIYGMMGDARVTSWLTSICDEELQDAALWQRLIKYLQKELKVQQEKSLIKRPESSKQVSRDAVRVNKSSYVCQQGDMKCSFCGETGHAQTNGPNKTSIIQYFACKKFVDMTPEQRYKELCSKGYCIQCLYPGASQNAGKHVHGACQKDFTCTHVSCNTSAKKKHVLVCQEHSQSKENIKVLNDYKSRCIFRQKVPLEDFSRNIKLSFLAYQTSPLINTPQQKLGENDDDVIQDSGIYILQTIQIKNKEFTLFFDTGCSDLVARNSAIQRIGDNAYQEIEGPVMLGGVGESKLESPYGIYQVKLPLHNGKMAVLSGICLDKITSTFPNYPLQGAVMQDIQNAYKSSGGDVSQLPSLPECIGGEVDFMLGVKYLRYHPQKVFSLPSGLTIYESPFLNIDGSRGVIGGPHAVFTEIERTTNLNRSSACQVSFLCQQYELYRKGYQVNPDNHLLSIKHGRDYDVMSEENERQQNANEMKCYALKRRQKHFEEAENAGSEILYRCVDCRKCVKCRHGEKIELISIKEEVEQDVIDKSVTVDTQAGITTARLPLLDNPVLKLAPNRNKAFATYKNQVKKLSKNESDKNDVIASEAKLQQLGHVDYIRNLSLDQQKRLKDNPIQNFIPWRSVWNGNSLSTPCRIVYDASQPTSSSYSLNDILAKGRNSMNRLVEIIIRWRGHTVGFHTDVQKMFNTVKLVEEHWCMQRYLWQEQLKPDVAPEEKIIKTLIYGVKPSGNQAELGLRNTAEKFKIQYPEVNQIVQRDIYVDDCLSGETSNELAFQRADELTLVLKRGGFGLKGFTFAGKPPLKELSEDGISVKVAGMKWFSESDELQLDVWDLNFAKKYRGKKVKSVDGNGVPEKLTRRHCVSKVAEVFDLTGRITPITAHMKLDLSVLVKKKLDWDDVIPDALRNVWISHFDMMNEISQIRFKRAVVPHDATGLDVDTIDAGDASTSIACVAIYVRFQRKCGEFSCQLIFSRSKILPDNITQPRAELFAANLNAHTGEVVKRSFGDYHKTAVKLTDSQITLHWINNRELPLKQWVRNRVIEISRFTDVNSWMYVKSSNMIADIGTRRGATIKDISPESEWNVGFLRMRKQLSEFPVKKYEIKLTESEESNAEVEMLKVKSMAETTWPATKIDCSTIYLSCNKNLPNEISERYEYSHYLIDPNKYRFRTVVRILAIVQRFIRNCRSKINKHIHSHPQLQNSCNVIKLLKDNDDTNCTLILTDEELNNAMRYFYKKATNEVKQFTKSKCYIDVSKEMDDILYHTGRILPTQEFSVISTMTEVMHDLVASTFCIPIVDKHSPLAYAVINEVHWFNKVAKHKGVETVLRYTMQYCFILEGRELVKQVRKGCERCRYLKKRIIGISMGPVSSYNLTVAPAFYISQIDLAGPFKAYSPHNKRTTVKIYFTVFCCSTTTTVSIKIMEDYSAAAFLQAFIRFSCEVGYPKVLLIDAGSQLIKGCESMTFNFQDVQRRLHVDMNVEFETCPVGGHNFHGRVERKIRHIKECVETSMQNERLSIIQWETICAEVSNSINDLPIAIGSIVSELENIDLLTPNRLRLGRNNDRSPVGPLFVSSKPDKFIQLNKKIFNTWFEKWIISHVPKLIMKPKWFKDDYDVAKGDVVLFLKQDDDFAANYQYGMIESVKRSNDGKIRSVDVKYRNHNEKFSRTTHRAVRTLVMIHHIDELNIFTELGEIATAADVKRKLQLENNDRL